MTDAFAMMIGYIMGWFSVVAAHRMLQLKEPEARVEPAKENLERGEAPEEKRWREELAALWNYDANYEEKGGAMSGNQEESRGYL